MTLPDVVLGRLKELEGAHPTKKRRRRRRRRRGKGKPRAQEPPRTAPVATPEARPTKRGRRSQGAGDVPEGLGAPLEDMGTIVVSGTRTPIKPKHAKKRGYTENKEGDRPACEPLVAPAQLGPVHVNPEAPDCTPDKYQEAI